MTLEEQTQDGLNKKKYMSIICEKCQDCKKYAEEQCSVEYITKYGKSGPDDGMWEEIETSSGISMPINEATLEECLNYKTKRCEDANKTRLEIEKSSKESEKKQKLKQIKQYGTLVGVPLAFILFSKYKKYDSKKTTKVTIIGSLIVFSAIALNGFSGAWDGETFTDRLFKKTQKN
jgi:hypothetical protein